MLYGQGLIDTAAALFRSARKRIWIATPYIGGWISVQRIMGTKWIGDLRIEIRILADISDTTALDRETIKAFQKRAEIRSLEGLHAKSYIIDNTILITSANLTGTAFQSRWEILD
jgi:phosphatidylserine/phosphatidylglycerophosphate/cardiolipin synthase-like enzyme